MTPISTLLSSTGETSNIKSKPTQKQHIAAQPIKSGLEGQEELYQRGLQILQASFEYEFKEASGFDKQAFLEKASQYESFEEFYQAEYTPEKVSGRILDFALGQFEKYYSQNSHLSREDALHHYANLIGGAVDKGFSTALSVLGDVDAETMAELEKSIELTHDGIDQWLNDQLAELDISEPSEQ